MTQRKISIARKCTFLKLFVFEINSLFLTEFFICYFGKNGPNLSSFNLKKVIYSTGFYSPPVIKIEDYEYSQLSMESFAAENRGFGQTRTPKLTKIGHFLAPI